MIGDLQIEALTHGCAACGKKHQQHHFVHPSYHRKDITSFEKQVELGILSRGVRNFWVHVDCEEPSLISWKMIPDLHTCIKCKNKFGDKDMIVPVFRIDSARVVNPSDPTDVGMTIGDRIYLMHADCKNTGMNRAGSNIITL